MKTMTLTTIGIAGLMLLSFATPVSAQAAAGAAEATFFVCPPNSDKVALTGTDNGDGTWTFTYAFVSTCDGYNNSGSATGPWSPAGGCAGAICLTNPSGSAPGPVTYDYSNAIEAHSGTATLVVA